ncbi:MetQ/NlpA family ABC transporter substrate-binding protein [uncultured Comamonas sp.]|uniref:MetQ/NlpA family ABC transporter substrate-binding protein n=1 Tax=uncultured Comamonas sp. TaxID=114710 RepID=UPI003747B84C
MNKRAFLHSSLAVLAATSSAFVWAADASAPKVIKVGIRGGVAEDLWTEVAKVAKTKGLNLELVVMSASVSPNEALNNGDLQANAFQHLPFLEEQVRQRGYKISAVGTTMMSPLAFYSRKHKRLEDLPQGAHIGITDDASNQARALIVLRDHGLIRLRDGFDPFSPKAGPADIIDNPRKLRFTEALPWCWRARCRTWMRRPSPATSPSRPVCAPSSMALRSRRAKAILMRP